MTITVATEVEMMECYALRQIVFVGEQNVPPDLERDEMDETAVHLIARHDGRAVGTARIVNVDDMAKIGRVCVLPDMRGTGLGAALIRKGIEIAQGQPGLKGVKLGAQLHALGFYEKLGFAAYGPVYDDAGIDHRDMKNTWT